MNTQESFNSEYIISACYFPEHGEIEISYEQNYGDRESCHLTLKVTPEQGTKLAKVVYPCVHYNALLKPKQPSDEEILELSGYPWFINDNAEYIASVRAALDKWGR